MLRRLLSTLGAGLVLALGGLAQAAPPPRIDLTVAPAWQGWTRPGRATEIDVRLDADTASRATLDLVAGRQSVRADLDLQPGRTARLQLPIASAETLTLHVSTPDGPVLQRELRLSQAESPLLGSALASGTPLALEGFHTVALTADDLPRSASAYASVDALVLDAPTLSALDRRQLVALLAHAAGCGRIVVIQADARTRGLLAGAGGCGGRALMQAGSAAEAGDQLRASLASSLPAALPTAALRELAPRDQRVWSHVATGLALYFAAATLLLVFAPGWPMLLAAALAALAAVPLLHTLRPPSQLLVWSEGESGAPVARYQAWQQFPGVVRERTRAALAPQLASFAQPCEPGQPLQFDLDPGRGQASSVAFETRLFQPVALCYAGSFPVARAVAATPLGDGGHEVHNTGTKAWPAGQWLDGPQVGDLPALAPDARAVVHPAPAAPRRDAVLRRALTRTQGEGLAALWPLDLAGVAGAPVESRGWLLVSVPTP